MKLNSYKGSLLATMALATALAGAQDIRVMVDGNPVNFNGQEPINRSGRVLVPLRGVFEEMGAFVQWNPATRTVTATRGDRDVRLNIGDRMAMVDGRTVTLDVPASVVNGRTLVPIRFLSESLGSQVTWNNASNMVMIYTDGRAQPINEPINNVNVEVLPEETVIPVSLDTRLSSNESRSGDRFTATVRTGNDRYYGGIVPAGSRIEGRVVTARPKSGNEPGLLELNFERIRLPNGSSYPLDGNLISLDNNSVIREENGMLRARSSNSDNRTVYAGYGAGAGLIVGLLTKRPLEGAILGGILGYIAGHVERDRNRPNDVQLAPGSEFGVRLTDELALRMSDIR